MNNGMSFTRLSLRCAMGLMLLFPAPCLFLPAPASAQQMESMKLAMNLGNVLASETFCGLTYNQDAISGFIDKHVKPEDMSFTSTLTMMTSGAEVQNREMSPSAKTAHCAQIVRVAKSYGFIK